MSPQGSELGSEGVWLEPRHEPWTGAIDGLGGISVDQMGVVGTHPAARAHLPEASRALASGWADLLSWVRRGYRLGDAVCVSDPDHDGRALLLYGETMETARAAVHLTGNGWRLVSDRPTPLAWDDRDLRAFPRVEPLIISRHLADDRGLVSRQLRHDSDAVTVDVPRATQPATIAAVAILEARRPGDSPLAELTGIARFEACTRVVVMGALTPTDVKGPPDEPNDPSHVIAEHIRLSGLPFAIIRSTDVADLDAMELLLDW